MTTEKIIEPREFDYTMMSTYMTCQRKYDFRMRQHIVPRRPSTAPEFGRCIHLALDEWYKNHDVEGAIDVFQRNFRDDPEDDKRTTPIGIWILQNYHAKYCDQPFKVLSTEREFRVPLLNGNYLIGRIDKIIEWDGTIWVMDHKTTSQLGPKFMNMHTPNLQFDGYTYAARMLGYEKCCGVLVDAILVAKGLLSSTSRNNLTPLLRDFAYRNNEDIAEYSNHATKIQGNIILSEINSEFTANFDACTYYGECPYRRICKEPRDMWTTIINQDYDHSVWSPTREEVK